MRRAAVLLAGLACATAGTAHAFTLTAPGGGTEEVAPSSLTGAARTGLDLSYATEHGAQTHHFDGVLLWDLLAAHKALGAERPRDRLREAVIVTGADGYSVILAMAEIDPAFEGKRVVLADQVDGKAPPAPRLAVPADAHGGRSVHDVVKIKVRAIAP